MIRVTKQFYGTVFINFMTPLGAAVAVGCHGMVLAGRPIRIEYSPYRKRGGSRGGTDGGSRGRGGVRGFARGGFGRGGLARGFGH